MKNIGIIAALLILLGCSQSAKVEWISTTIDHPWTEESGAVLHKSTAGPAGLVVNPDSARQIVDGFGGCFNELGWDALQALNDSARQTVLKNLFDTIAGCRFTIFRMPIGANDYADDWYSLDETPDDYNLKDFSLDRDRQRLIPYIKSAQQFIPDMKVWASPWCPPSWMKTNRSYACASNPQVNDLPANLQGEEMKTQFRMEPRVLESYALYFEKFVQSYRAEGIPIWAVHVQNEMNSCQPFPSCIWRPEDLATFIGDYLGPKFEADGLATQIWYGTVERPQVERVDTVLHNQKAAKYILGVGFQWAGKGAIAEVHRKYPSLKLMQTETECGDGSNDWAAAEHTFGLMRHYFENGANAYMYWNMVLDETGKSRWGWKQNSMISIDKTSGKVTYNPEYYLMKHLSYFVEPGSKYIPVNDPNCLAFVKENQMIMFYYNSLDSDKKLQVKAGANQLAVTLKPKSFNTFRFRF